jgi:DNA-binding NarL/FixJ family response regulator
VGDVASGEEALKVVKKLAPDVVLMDIRMPGMDGFKTNLSIRRLNRNIAVIILTGYESEIYAAEALRTRASGYITKDCSKKLLIDAIRVVKQGGTVWQSNQLHHSHPETTDAQGFMKAAPIMPSIEKSKPPEKQLTSRELEILSLLAKGYSNKQISNNLDLADVTVKKHITSIMFKLSVRNRTQAALSAVQLGLI